MAEVHRALMTGPRGFLKTVALKRILPIFGEVADFRERFIEEARVAADLTHSNIVHLYDFGEISGTYYLSMELVNGMDADELVHLAMTGGESMRFAAPYIVAQAARGLAFAHAAMRDNQPMGLVHRDVSPQNILISRNGEVKVTDFGIVKVTTGVNRLTATGAIMGKLRYMSPEQAMKAPLDGRSDIFALGLVLQELLTGECLLDAPSPAAVIQQLKEGDFQAPSSRNPEVPPDLDAIVANALALDREARYASADDMARDLERHLRVFGGGFGREEMRALVARLGSEREARQARWDRQQNRAGEPVSPWLAVGSDETPARRTRDDAVTSPMSLPEATEPPAATPHPTAVPRAPAEVVSGVVEVGRKRVASRLNGPLAIAAGVLLGGVVVAMVWLGRPARSAPASSLAAPRAAPSATSPAAPSELASANLENLPSRRRLIDGKPVVFDDEPIASVARDADETRELTVARAASRSGDRALASGELAEAERFYHGALGHYAGYVAAYRGLGQVYARSGNPELALSMFDQYLRAAPAASDGEIVRGWAAQLAREPTKALEP